MSRSKSLKKKKHLRNGVHLPCFFYPIKHSVSASSSSQFLPILTFGIVACTFTPYSENLSENSCIQTTTTTTTIITTKNCRNPSYQLCSQHHCAWRLPWRSPDWQRTKNNIRKRFTRQKTKQTITVQRSKLTFSKRRLLATFNCKMVAMKRNSVAKNRKKSEGGGHFMKYYMTG